MTSALSDTSHPTHATYHPFSTLPDEMCLGVAFHLQLHEVETLRAVSRRFAGDRPLCFRYQQLAAGRWRHKQMGTARPLLRRLLEEEQSGRTTWRDIFWRVESDGVRGRITEEELVRLRWAFSDGAQTCDFRRDAATGERTLRMQHHGEMPWRINDNHAVEISRFPEHVVERLPSWGWVIKNQFIFIISIEEKEAEDEDEAEEEDGSGASQDAAAACGTDVEASAAASLRGSRNHDEAFGRMTQSQINAAFLNAARQAGSAAAPLEPEALARGQSVIRRILDAMFLRSQGPEAGQEDDDDDEEEEEEGEPEEEEEEEEEEGEEEEEEEEEDEEAEEEDQ
jgi:hypothetical protein